MTLQARLTLGFVLLATVIVAAISVVYLGTVMDLKFESVLSSASSVGDVTLRRVQDTLNSQPQLDVRAALASEQLAEQLRTAVTYSEGILNVAVVDEHDEILADSLSTASGTPIQHYDSFEPLVTKASWTEKFQVITRPNASYYQVQRALGPPTIYIRVVVAPAFIKKSMIPALKESANIAIISVVCAIALTFLFSAFAFRPLGRLRRQVDLLASGQYEPEGGAARVSNDDVSIMASKVSLLGERLRGAQFEVSDLRGNIDRLLQDLEDAVFIFNREDRLVFASGSVGKLLSRERDSLAGSTLSDVFPPSGNLGFLIAQASESGMSIRNRRIPMESVGEEMESGEEPPTSVLLSVDTLQSEMGGRTGLLVRLRDPEAQRQIGRQLQTADRLAAISRISGGVAHEVKNPLNAILLHVEVARTRLARGETDVTPQMEVISREILRLDRVVKTFLDFTRPVELKYRVVKLNDVLSEIIDLAKPQAEAEHIQLQVQLDPDGIEVKLDRDLFKQAILNVMVNAMQSMKGGGELRVACAADHDTVEIRIADTGSGIPPELREKIFRLYFTTKEGGSGIGLAMTFRIVQLHDGTIDFSSEPGKGTTFVIRLPIAV